MRLSKSNKRRANKNGRLANPRLVLRRLAWLQRGIYKTPSMSMPEFYEALSRAFGPLKVEGEGRQRTFTPVGGVGRNYLQ